MYSFNWFQHLESSVIPGGDNCQFIPPEDVRLRYVYNRS